MFNFNDFLKISECFIDLASQGDEIAAFGASVLEAALNAAFSYVKTVDERKTCIVVDRGIIHPLEYQDRLKKFVQDEAAYLNSVICNLNVLQRMQGDYISGSIFTGDIDNPKDVIAFCGEVSRVIFDTDVEGV